MVFGLTKIGLMEKLLQADKLCALLGGCAYLHKGLFQIVGRGVRTIGLQRRDLNRSGFH